MSGGYHLVSIPRGAYGKVSKIREELEELEDAMDQECRIMMLLELSDIYGALEAVVYGLGMDMGDVAKMAAITKRAFEAGERK